MTVANNNNLDDQVMEYEDLLQKIGGYGRAQLFIQVVYILAHILDITTLMTMYFGGLPSSWKCNQNSTVCNFNGTLDSTNTLRCQLPKDSWTYTEPIEFSIVTDFNADCDKSWVIDMSMSMAFLGIMVGGIMNGYLSDRFGRRNVVIPNLIVAICFGGLAALAPNLPFLFACRFMTGLAQVLPVILPHLNEVVEAKHRAVMSTFIAFGCVSGSFLVSMTSYLTKNWRHSFLCVSLPFAALLPILCMIPESPRFYITKGRKRDALESLQKMARWNKREWDDCWDVKITHKASNSSPCDLFSTADRMKKSAFLVLSFTTTGLTYFALSFAASEFHLNVYFSFGLLSVIDIPGIFWAAYSCNRFGRKRTVLVSAVCCGASFVIIPYLPLSTASLRILHLSVGMFGKFMCIVFSMSMITWGLELFPTGLRGQAYGVIQISNKGGGLLAPWLVNSGQLVHKSFPFLCMGLLCFLSAIVSMAMPETNKMPLQDFIEASPPLQCREDDKEELGALISK